MSKKKNRIRKPVIKWQSGEYAAEQQLTFEFPIQFLMLCKLANTSPFQLLTDFIDNISCGTWKREGRDKAKSSLIDYFIEHGYGRHSFTPDELRLMFRELDAISLLFPKDAEPALLHMYADWREKYQQYWFSKWNKQQ